MIQSKWWWNIKEWWLFQMSNKNRAYVINKYKYKLYSKKANIYYMESDKIGNFISNDNIY